MKLKRCVTDDPISDDPLLLKYVSDHYKTQKNVQ